MENVSSRPDKLSFLKVAGSPQAYCNLLYVLAAFPLGVLYFVFLTTGLCLGVSLLIVWLGVPVLLAVGVSWWMLARFERSTAIHVLKEEIPEPRIAAAKGATLWARLKGYPRTPSPGRVYSICS